MVVSVSGANFHLTTFEGDHGMSSRIFGGLHPFLATSGAVGEKRVGATFRVAPFVVWLLGRGMTIDRVQGIRCMRSGGSGGRVWYFEVDNRSRCDRPQVGGHRWKHTKLPNSGQGPPKQTKIGEVTECDT